MTKIVCTIGPASDSDDALKSLMRKGMNVARLNFSHGTQEQHKKVIARIRALSKEINKPISILQDLAGPKIRIGEIENGSVNLKFGNEFILTSRKVPGDENEVSLNYKDLPSQVETNDTILLSDGSIELEVREVSSRDIITRVLVGGELTSRKGVNLPTRSLSISAFTKKDKKDLEFGMRAGIDMIALSFVKDVEDVLKVKRFIKKRDKDLPLIAKIEKHEALENIDSILDSVDGIMVARGDLGVEIPLEKVPVIQKELINKANRAGKTVITATQMLKSMVDNARPTRAEAADVTNAILDGTDAVMLSEESAVGKYPARAVEILNRISKHTIGSSLFQDLVSGLRSLSPNSDNESLCLAACNLADNIGASTIIAFTESGATAAYLSKFRPRQKVFALTPSLSTYRYLALVWGIAPLLVTEQNFNNRELRRTIKKKLETGLIKTRDKIIITDEKSLRLHELQI